MSLQNVQSKEMSLVLSSDAKPRLKWTQELHQRFIDAVNQLGGAEKATPKSLMRVMGIHGLTLYHLKSHLQKYRLGRSQQSQTYHQNKQEDYGENQRSHMITSKISDGAQQQINESLQIAKALQMQMEVQRKLHEQIEVQRHLQLRIEAQGKYLQSVLKKAQETLSGYSSCSIEVEHAKAQLSELVSMVDSGCPSSSFSFLTQSEGSIPKKGNNKLLVHNGCSLESSLTSSESSGTKEETQTMHGVDKNSKLENAKTIKGKRNSVMLSLMEMHPTAKNVSESQSSNKKRCKSNINEQSTNKNSGVQRLGLLENIDLNCKFLNEFDSGSKVIDLNCKGVELFNGNFSN